MADDNPVESSYDLFIDGESVPAADGDTFQVTNPSTGERLTSVAAAKEADVNEAVETAHRAADEWTDMLPPERGRILNAVAERIREDKERLAKILVYENGKPLDQAEADVELGARYFEYYAGICDKIQGESIPLGNDYADYTIREPLGVTAQIIPWNFPVNLFGRSCAPALAAGNAVVAKPAEQTPITAVEVGKLAVDAGLPPGTLNVIPGLGAEAGAPLSSHSDINGVSFTGSVPTGREVAKAAAENLTEVHIEAGGKNPNVVFPDANIENAIENTITSIFGVNAGQVCSSGDRLLVHEDIHDEFVDRLVDRVEDLTVGPPMDDPDVGALVSEEQYDKVNNYIDVGTTEVGEPITGGEVLDGSGYFVEPTIFDGVDNDMRIAQEEIFGPVLAVITFSDYEEAIELSNDVPYGLVGGIFTKDISRANRFARDIDAGQIYINEWFAGGVETPFGGYKDSGFGREKGIEAIDSFTQTKNVGANISVSHED